MAAQNSIPKIILFLFLFAAITKTTFSQNCKENKGCSGATECCSRWGYCGTTDEHCSLGCFSGPCTIVNSPRRYGLNTTPRGEIESVVTPAWFNRIMSKVGSNCTGKGFYTHRAFITAAKSFGEYNGTVDRREIAAMLAHFSYGSGSFCHKEEITNDIFCSSSKKYPCEPGKKYYGRGPIQSIKWNEYYGAAGKYLGLPLLKDPDMVARSPEVSFRFAMWFWKRRVRPAVSLSSGATTIKFNSICDGITPEELEKLLDIYCQFMMDQGFPCIRDPIVVC